MIDYDIKEYKCTCDYCGSTLRYARNGRCVGRIHDYEVDNLTQWAEVNNKEASKFKGMNYGQHWCANCKKGIENAYDRSVLSGNI